ncbi:hypothetical protein CK203_006530 [Vitis vinifera]|uniref:Uncharacterized protein n=1 Tax=Vitis vinifera TaxID=29760 RepID=A0A438KAT8_VITVI|nr:hypothetical protein CK203_006530 [Vitis vinifera]
MIDSKVVMSQVQELQIILHEIHAKKMVLNESFQVATMIEKLPPSWKDYLKHKHKEMGLEDLIVRLRIEADNQVSNKKPRKLPIESKANLVEQKLGKKRKYSSEGHDKKNQVHMTKEEKPATDVSDMMHSAMVFGANTMDNPKE